MNSFTCHYFQNQSCRSCSHLDSSSTDLERDRKYQQLCQRLAPFAPDHSHALVSPTVITGSRNKAKIVVGGTVDNPILGIRDKEGALHSVPTCPLHMPAINQLLEAFAKGIGQFKLTPYDLSSKKGELKYLIIFCSPQHQELMIRAVLRSKESLDRLRIFYQQLQRQFPQLKVCTANIQPQHSAVLEGEQEIVLSAANFMRADLGEVALFIGPKSFYQVTSEIARQLYQRAADILIEEKTSLTLDLFCGVGAFGQFLVKKGMRVVGVELSADAIECAQMANKLNGGLGEYIAQDATEFMKAQRFDFSAIIVNPPRRGLNTTIIDKIKEVNPKTILYSSCNPLTLARDLEHFLPEYRIKEFTPYDMFPLTEHLEVLAHLVPA